MQIRLVLEVDDDEAVDEGHDVGITEEAYSDLVAALSDVGFTIVDGPDKME